VRPGDKPALHIMKVMEEHKVTLCIHVYIYVYIHVYICESDGGAQGYTYTYMYARTHSLLVNRI